jgi:hypothetical protein
MPMNRALHLALCCGIVAAAGCASAVDVPSALEVTQLSSGWFDAGLDSLGRNKIVPSVSFRLENETAQELGYLQINAVFRRAGETEGWGTKFVRVAGTEGIPAGEATPMLRLDSSRGYTGEQSQAEMLGHTDFVDVEMDLYIKHRTQQWALVDTVDVDRQLLVQ